MGDRVTVCIENVQVNGITDVLLAIERANGEWFDQEQHDRVTELVLGLREARSTAIRED